MFSILKHMFAMAREMYKMTFTTKSRIVHSYAILILAGRITIEDVPNFSNLREVVLEVLSAE